MMFALLLLAAAPMTLDRQLIAEPSPSAEGSQLLAQLVPDATLERDAGVRLWRVRDATAALVLLEARASGRFAPVQRDGSAAGAMRVAKGGVLVIIPREWDDARLRRWADAAKVSAKRLGSSVAWVPSAPGEAALKLARQLDGAEVKAQPDWWVVHVPK